MAELGDQTEGRGRALFRGISPLAVAAHELKAPLALIRQLSFELEDERLGSQDRAMLIEQIRLISEKSLRLSTNLTKIERLQSSLFPTGPLNLAQVCDEVLHEIGPLYTAYGRQFRYCRRRVPAAIANHDLLRRILLNFADNALHYSDEDGVVELYTQLLRTKNTIRIGVRDYGPALPSQLWRHIRENSNQPQTIHTRPASSGMGIAISSSFAQVFDGKVGAIRHRDGASFYVEIPVSKQLALL